MATIIYLRVLVSHMKIIIYRNDSCRVQNTVQYEFGFCFSLHRIYAGSFLTIKYEWEHFIVDGDNNLIGILL